MKDQSKKKLEDVLQSASDRLFPAETGTAKVCLDSTDRDGDNALHVFIWGHETENALFLIESGIHINAVGEMGETPLHAALKQNNIAVIKALLNANARTDIVSEFGKTAMDLAKEKGLNLEIIVSHSKELNMSFDTPLYLCGPLREPKQMLADQEYSGHTSIHDDSMAEKLGFRAGPIEGPTHFSQFVPLLAEIWGQAWFERGRFSAHFQNMVVEGEQVRAFVERPAPGATRVRAWAEKADGTPVLEATAGLGPHDGDSLLDLRMAKLRPPEKMVILSDLHVGMTGVRDEPVRMDPDRHMGTLYPFTLNQKLECITENSSWYSDGRATPWGRAVIPLEMVSVLGMYTSKLAGFPVKQPVVGLFVDLEIRMLDGPLFVGEDYLIRREIAALSESRRTESYWVRTRIYDAGGETLKAELLLNHATLKNSYADYEAEAL